MAKDHRLFPYVVIFLLMLLKRDCIKWSERLWKADTMYDDMITFQLATHFLSRIALRLEFLFKTITEASTEQHEVIHRFALKNIIEIVEIVEKPELKSRFLKELIRIEHILRKTNSSQTQQLFTELQGQIYQISQVPGLFGGDIHNDEFLKTLRQIHHPHTKECEFNSPQLVLWFDSDPVLRQNAIRAWQNKLLDLKTIVDVYLKLLRAHCEFNPIKATNGYYQKGISSQQGVIHLIQLRISKSLKIVPKFQLGHHNLTIRFFDLTSNMEIHDQSIEMDIAFSQI